VNASFLEHSWRAAFRMAGRDRARFLHGMCTQEIKKLAPGQSSLGAIVNRQGKMVAEITVIAQPDELLVITDRATRQATMDHLSKFLVADAVTLAPDDRRVVGVYEASVPAELPSAADPSLPIPGRLVLAADAAAVVPGARPMTEAEYEALRIENGFPRWGVDMGPDLLPMEAGLEPIAISYTKGCYIGQEVIQRVKTYSEPPRMLVQLEGEGASPGQKISAGAEEIGLVTSATPRLALGVVKKDFKAPGTRVTIVGREAVVRALPWQARLT